jgi:hypothetical protein
VSDDGEARPPNREDCETVSLCHECKCGSTVDGSGERRNQDADVQLRRDDCGRQYVATVTQFEWPSPELR